MKSDKLLEIVIKVLSEHHGEETQAYDMKGISILADYYVVTSAGSNRQLHAISDAILQAVHESGLLNVHVEGTRDSNWLLVDLGDVVVNIFTNEARSFYGLEKLWSAGKQVALKEA